MATAPRPVEMDALCDHLQRNYVALLQGVGNNDQDRLYNFRSKALLGFALEVLAGAQPAEAAAAVVDGADDNGVDAIHVSLDGTLWLLQSKYKHAARGEPELADVTTFCQGVRLLLAGQLGRFNPSVQALQQRVLAALDDATCRVRVVLVHTGGALSPDRRRLFNDLENEFNRERPGFMTTAVHGLAALHALLVEGQRPQPITLVAELRSYGFADEPYRAVYGRISSRQLAEWGQRYGAQLVEQNLRRFKRSTDVNRGLAVTLREQPAEFFYFNNGVTLLCESFSQVGVRDQTRERGRFSLHRPSIINGAQTVGAIAAEPVAHYDALPSEVLVTIVSLEQAPLDFGQHVTRNRNRQNAVDIRDFAALDVRQQHWRDALQQVGVQYICQAGDDAPAPGPSVFHIDEAARALACCRTGADWSADVVSAATEPKRLFRTAPASDAALDALSPYERVFPDSLQAKALWRAVQVARLVNDGLLARARSEADPADLPPGCLRAADLLREGRWLVLHLVFLKTELHVGEALALTEAEKQRLSSGIDRLAQVLVEQAQAQTWGKQAAAVFANRTDCEALKTAMMRRLSSERL